jgi:hypothetical protein
MDQDRKILPGCGASAIPRSAVRCVVMMRKMDQDRKFLPGCGASAIPRSKVSAFCRLCPAL